MAKEKEKSGTHLTRDERHYIEIKLNEQKSIRSIASDLKRSPSTILREIKRNSQTKSVKQNDCALKSTCKKVHACGNDKCFRKCNKCVACRKYCSDYVIRYECDDLKKPPYVCNGCHKRVLCNYQKVFYDTGKANSNYLSKLVNSRTGFYISNGAIIRIDELASPLLKNGLSPYHIKQALGDELPISESTLRRMIHKCELSARNIDLREQVKRKPRKSDFQKMNNELVIKKKIGKMYQDFREYISENEVSFVEMDCVEGAKEDNATLLTLHFPHFGMQLAIIMEFHTSACVVNALNMIETSLGKELFAEIFPLILTDNGHEFLDIDGMETSIYGGQRTKIFFCEPNRSDEKGSCENNHKRIRYVIPKGTSLEPFNQSDITLMMNHINSYCRKSLFGKSPYQVAKTILPEDFFILLGLEEILSEAVILKPQLLSKRVLQRKCNTQI